jgi:hypothetical protein
MENKRAKTVINKRYAEQLHKCLRNFNEFTTILIFCVFHNHCLATWVRVVGTLMSRYAH